MLFRWLTARRRQKLRRQPFPPNWRQFIEQNVHHFARLSGEQQKKLCEDVQVFVSEKQWEGCGGLTITDEIKATIAAQACLLVLAFQDEYFDQVASIVVYPDSYVAPEHEVLDGGMVIEGNAEREGEAWYRGPVVLSWTEALAGGRQESRGSNLVLHEFAHQLDMQSGEIDGMPRLRSNKECQRWKKVVGREFEKLARDCQQGRRTVLDCYGAEEPSEFFAVATESFFENPRELSQRHPSLYRVLQDYYLQDPADR